MKVKITEYDGTVITGTLVYVASSMDMTGDDCYCVEHDGRITRHFVPKDRVEVQ